MATKDPNAILGDPIMVSNARRLKRQFFSTIFRKSLMATLCIDELIQQNNQLILVSGSRITRGHDRVANQASACQFTNKLWTGVRMKLGFLHMEKGIQESAMILRKQTKQQTKRDSRIFEVCMQSKAKRNRKQNMLAKLQVR